jgi:hypothetical protein
MRATLTCSAALALAACGGDGGAAIPGEPSYQWLSETGLYSDPAAHTLSSSVRAFEPAFVLWSDGADKARWIDLPEGATIDTSDPSRWVLPVGTRLWKEFSLGSVRLETRVIERYGAGPSDYWMGAFVWQEDGTDARLTEQGEQDLRGTPHDAPGRERCGACHNGEPGRALGFGALQLARSPLPAGLDLAQLAGEGRLSTPPAAAASYIIGGEAEAEAALGYLHANCGHCHNPRGAAWPDTQMLLRLELDASAVQTAAVLGSVVGQPLQYYRDQGGAITLRVAPGEPEQSGIVARMRVRGPKEQMPPLATEQVDEPGVALVSRWIESLPPLAQ